MANTIEEEKALHECLKGQIVKLCMDSQGTHVMQKYVKVLLLNYKLIIGISRRKERICD